MDLLKVSEKDFIDFLRKFGPAPEPFREQAEYLGYKYTNLKVKGIVGDQICLTFDCHEESGYVISLGERILLDIDCEGTVTGFDWE
jgi:hypothetical protein